MFEKDHVFIYGTKGVCRVKDICTCDYGAGRKEYYILQPVFDSRLSLSIPVDSPVLSSRARELLSEEFAWVLGINPKEVAEFIIKRIGK